MGTLNIQHRLNGKDTQLGRAAHCCLWVCGAAVGLLWGCCGAAISSIPLLLFIFNVNFIIQACMCVVRPSLLQLRVCVAMLCV